MKRVLLALVLCAIGSSASACDVAVGSVAVSVPAVYAPQAVVVQSAGFAFAFPAVTAFATPVVVQSQPVVVQTRVVRRGRIFPRTRVVTRVVR